MGKASIGKASTGKASTGKALMVDDTFPLSGAVL
jgi:hypothetical protein